MEGYTSIRSATLALHDLNVLVGANGAGKSNFIRALGMLGRIVDSDLSLFVGLADGASALMSVADSVRLRWLQEGSDTVLPADALSDGTLRFICLAVLLGQSELPGLIILDEPELGLHPFAIVQLADMLRTASRASQVLLATQSVTLMNQFELGDLVVVERQGGSSVFERPDPARLGEWLAEYSLGELWEKNMLGGRPRPERGRLCTT